MEFCSHFREENHNTMPNEKEASKIICAAKIHRYTEITVEPSADFITQMVAMLVSS